MADRTPAPDTPELRARWSAFAWTPENRKTADWHIAKYPEGRQRSAVMPLLDLAQRQVGVREQRRGARRRLRSPCGRPRQHRCHCGERDGTAP
jgi:NADH-quinone oxidoreductase subunit E